MWDGGCGGGGVCGWGWGGCFDDVAIGRTWGGRVWVVEGVGEGEVR